MDMIKLISVATVTFLSSMTTHIPHGNKSIKLINPCDYTVVFGAATSSSSSTYSSITVNAGATYKKSMKEGVWIKFRPKGANYTNPIGKVEFDGQTFKCECE